MEKAQPGGRLAHRGIAFHDVADNQAPRFCLCHDGRFALPGRVRLILEGMLGQHSWVSFRGTGRLVGLSRVWIPWLQTISGDFSCSHWDPVFDRLAQSPQARGMVMGRAFKRARLRRSGVAWPWLELELLFRFGEYRQQLSAASRMGLWTSVFCCMPF
jgi:hypothetical protein